MLLSVIHKLVNSIWNKEELPDQWKESIIPIHKKGDKIDCISIVGYRCYQHHTKCYRISCSRGTYVDEIIGDHECGFRRNRSTIDKIFCIRQILEKEWQYNETVHQLFIDFKKPYDSVRREGFYNILCLRICH
jgi:hypothetical protein